MLNKKMKFLNEMEYEAMGAAIGFTTISGKTIKHFPKWKKMTTLIRCMDGFMEDSIQRSLTETFCKE